MMDAYTYYIILEPSNKRIIDGQCFSLDLILMLKGNAAQCQTRPPK